ncbi:unnamed protein product [Leptidea sinapis]|uniref:Uncharacterized protein n=1 Tax=Leptidea sinapis TaxID=189913 RepID=A0A5E4QNX1_9NEOP|nr:unnamed protein product [Leptidea sinapis]
MVHMDAVKGDKCPRDAKLPNTMEASIPPIQVEPVDLSLKRSSAARKLNRSGNHCRASARSGTEETASLTKESYHEVPKVKTETDLHITKKLKSHHIR